MSRIALWLLPVVLAVPVPVAAQSADAVLARAQRLTGVDADGCPREQEAEIIVCGQPRESRSQRLPYPSDAVERVRMPRGEIASATAAPIRPGACGTLLADRCGGGLNVFALVPAVARLASRLVDPDAAANPPPLPERR